MKHKTFRNTHMSRKKILIIISICLGSIVLIIFGLYFSLQFYISDDEVTDVSSIDYDNINELVKYIEIVDWDSYKISIPSDIVGDELIYQGEKYLESADINYDIIINDCKVIKDGLQFDISLKKGFLRLPFKADAAVSLDDGILEIVIEKMKCGWIKLNPSSVLPSQYEERIMIDLEKELPDNLPFIFNELSMSDESVDCSLKLDIAKVKLLAGDYITKIPREIDSDIELKKVEDQVFEIKIDVLDDVINEYFADYLKEQELPLGIQIISSDVDIANEHIDLDLQWGLFAFDAGAEFKLLISDNILYIQIKQLSIVGFPINESVLSYFQEMMGGFSIDFTDQDMPPWLYLHSAEIIGEYLSIIYSIDTPLLYETELTTPSNFLASFGVTAGDTTKIVLDYEFIEASLDNLIQNLIKEYDTIETMDINLPEREIALNINLYDIMLNLEIPFDLSGKDDVVTFTIKQPSISINSFEIPEDEIKEILEMPISIDLILDEFFPPEAPQLYDIILTDDNLTIVLIITN